MCSAEKSKPKGQKVFDSGKPACETGNGACGRVWLERDGKFYIGGGRAMLLERIDESGSIAAAARSMGLGYRNAWLWIDKMNKISLEPVVEKTAGGTSGPHTRLTPEGRKAIRDYRKLQAEFQEFLKRV